MTGTEAPLNAHADRGTLPVGALGVLVDHVLGARISKHVDADMRMVTSHIHIELVRPLAPAVRRVSGRTTVLDVVPGSAFPVGDLSADDGTVLAHISARFSILDGTRRAGSVVVDSDPVAHDTSHRPIHPWTTSPIDRALGTEVVGVEDDRVALRVVADPSLSNERGGLHGGVGTAMGERACALAMRSAAGEGHRYVPVEMRVLFVRPIAASGIRLALDGGVGYLGTTTATATSRLYRPDGKLAVQTDVVYAVPPT